MAKLTKPLLKSAIREIGQTKSRFISIFGIVAIGIGFFTGVSATEPDMRLTADTYYDAQSLMDFRLVSTFGFDEVDMGALYALGDGVEVYPAYFYDVKASSAHHDGVVRVMSLPEYGENPPMNQLEIIEGRFPESKGECLVDYVSAFGGEEIGSALTLATDGETLSREEYTIVGYFNSSMYVDMSARGSTTVGNGSIDAIVYIPADNFDLEVYTEVYVRVGALAGMNTYEADYKALSAEWAKTLEAVGDTREDGRYQEILAEAMEEIADAEQELAEAEEEVYAELLDARAELDDAKAEIADGERELADALVDLEDGERDLAEGRQELADGEADYAEGKEIFETEIADAEREIAENREKLEDGKKAYVDGLSAWEDGWAQYSDGLALFEEGEAEYLAGLAEFQAGEAEYLAGKAQLDEAFALYEGGLAELEAAAGQIAELKTQMEQALLYYGEASAVYQELLALYTGSQAAYQENLAFFEAMGAQLYAQQAELEVAGNAIDESRKQLEAAGAEIEENRAVLTETGITLEEAKAELDKAAAEIADGFAQLEEGEVELATAKAEGIAELEEARAKLDEGWQELLDGERELAEGRAEYEDGLRDFHEGKLEYEDGEREYAEGLAEAEAEFADARKEIAEARQELLDLDNPKWYVFDRDDNPGFTEYGENALRIANIAKVFPVFFILVAGLVCLTTIQRMVEDQRQQIGTYKALGYSSGNIIFKYMLYAVSSTLLGSAAGVIIGMKLFPFVIISAYQIMYTNPLVVIPYDWALAGASTLVAVLILGATVLYACWHELREQPSQLMRPKAPKNGKRVLLERVGFIWSRLRFSHKVTVRNLFRYKRRMLMTVIGVSGCTALLLTGFALRDSIGDIVGKQFEEITTYSGVIATEEELSDEELARIDGVMAQYGAEYMRFSQKQYTISANGASVEAYIVVPEDESRFGEFIRLAERTGDKREYAVTDGLILTEKAAKLLDIAPGEAVDIAATETRSISAQITGVVENYVNNYIYMTEDAYIALFGSAPEYGIGYFNLGEELDTAAQDGFAEALLDGGDVFMISFIDEMRAGYVGMMEALDLVIIVIILTAGGLALVVLYNLTNINITERVREIATLKVLGFYDREVDGYIFRENILLTLMGAAAGLVLGVFLANFVIETAEIDVTMFGREIHLMSYVWSAVITVLFSLGVSLFMHFKLIKVDMAQSLKSVE